MTEHSIRLRRWAELNGYSYRGALRRFHAGHIDGSYKDPHTGSLFVRTHNTANRPGNRAALYARVSTRKQEPHLQPQLSRLRDYAASRGYVVATEVTEVASGMNDQRPQLTALLNDDQAWDVLVVEYRDRLARFGFHWIRSWLESTGRRVEVANDSERGDSESLADDLISVIASFTGRMYGKRGARNRALKAAHAAGVEMRPCT